MAEGTRAPPTTRAAPDIAALVLAAGASARFGSPKALAVVDGQPVIVRVVRAAADAGLRPVVVVAADGRVATLAAGGGAVVVRLPGGEPPSATLRAGLAAFPDVAAVAVFVADQPFVDADLVRAVMAAWRGGALIARPVAGGTYGHPVVFDRRYLEALRALRGEDAGRAVMAEHASAVVEVALDDPLRLADFDTEDELRELRAARRRAAPRSPRLSPPG